MQTQTEVEHHFLVNDKTRNIHDQSDLKWLRGRQQTDTPISLNDIQRTIRKLEVEVPEETQLNKTLLTDMPESALTKVQWFFNHTIAMVYFPDKCNTGMLKFIPKSNTDHANTINYKSISLLEITGKILKKIISTLLKEFLDTQHITRQHGFRNNTGTDTGLNWGFTFMILRRDRRRCLTFPNRGPWSICMKIGWWLAIWLQSWNIGRI